MSGFMGHMVMVEQDEFNSRIGSGLSGHDRLCLNGVDLYWLFG